jgi:CubicO group peptidase (beta-lactamase class C family)
VLGHVISLKAGASYESLVMERICRPLHMDSTCVTLAPEMKSRLALGHDDSGKIVPNWEFQAYVGAGALRSTASDLLKYVSANMDLTHSSLTPLMEKTHVIRHRGAPGYGNTAMAWMDRGASDKIGKELIGHAGGTGGYESFIGFDKKNQRGVVVLASQQGGLIVEKVGWLLLEGVTLGPEIGAGVSALSKANAVGVGLHLDFDRPTRTIRIVGVLPNSPASKAGIKAGVTVHKIGDVPTADISLEHCACLIRGVAGTTVRLELIDAQGATNTVELTRQKVLIPSSQPG